MSIPRNKPSDKPGNIGEELLKTVSLLRSVVDSTVNGILVIDRKGKVSLSNNRFREMWKIPASLIKCKDDKKLLEFVLNQLTEPKKFMSKVNYLYSHPQEESFDVIYFKDGRIFERYSRPQSIGSKIAGRVWSFSDVTESHRAEEKLKESEQMFRSIVENSKEMIMLTAPNGKVSYLSPSSGEVIGWRQEDIIGTFPDIFHPEDKPHVFKALSEALHSKSGKNMQYRVIGNDKKVRWISHSWNPLIEKGRLRSIVSVVSNIDEIKKAEFILQKSEENLRKLYDDAKKISEIKSVILREVSHELKSPVALITLTSSLLKEECQKDSRDIAKVKRYVEMIDRNSRRFAKEVDTLLDFSRLETMREVEKDSVDIHSLLEEIKQQDSAAAEEKGLTIIVNAKKQMVVRINHEMVYKLIKNLVDNGIKFTKKGSITLSAKRQGVFIVLSVKDTGAGISKEYIESGKMYQPFLKPEASVKGLGLGLAICKKIVDLHNGEIKVNSRLGKGTEFIVRMPVK